MVCEADFIKNRGFGPSSCLPFFLLKHKFWTMRYTVRTMKVVHIELNTIFNIFLLFTSHDNNKEDFICGLFLTMLVGWLQYFSTKWWPTHRHWLPMRPLPLWAKHIWWVLYRWRTGTEVIFYSSHSHLSNSACVQTATILSTGPWKGNSVYFAPVCSHADPTDIGFRGHLSGTIFIVFSYIFSIFLLQTGSKYAENVSEFLISITFESVTVRLWKPKH